MGVPDAQARLGEANPAVIRQQTSRVLDRGADVGRGLGACLLKPDGSHLRRPCLFFFNVGTFFFKVFIAFVTVSLLFYVLVFWLGSL